MMNWEQKKLVHNQIILDLAVRTLERDREQVDNLKSKIAFKDWFEQKIKEATKDKIKVKRMLSAQGIRIENEKREDDLITVYEVLYRGATEFIRYSNIALRNWTNEEIKRLLNIEYRKPEVKRASYHE